MQITFRSVCGAGLTGLLVLLGGLSTPNVSRGQTTPDLLKIQIGPTGAAVELKGPENTLTASPNSIVRPMTGWYKLKASHRGFENFTRDLYIDAQSPSSITGTLSAKSRWKAGARAVFIPGWGHYYSDRVPRGVAFTALTAGMAVGYLFFKDEADDQMNQYEETRARYDAAESVAEQEGLEVLAKQDLESAYEADSDRLTWAYITLGVYLYQIIDAVVFFPSVPEVQFGPMQLGLIMPDGKGVGLGATYDF